MTQSKQEDFVRSYFDSDSGKYTKTRYPSEATTCDQHSYVSRKAHVLQMLDQLGQVDGAILDIGCGPGIYTLDLLRRGWRVWAVDISPKMLGVARESVAGEPERARAHFTVAQITNLPFPSSGFDAVLCIGVISYVEDVSAALSEMARVLRPGGRAVLQISNKRSPFEHEIRLRRFLASHAGAGTRDGAEDRLRSRISLQAYRPSSFEARCRECGFQKRDFRYYDFRLPVLGRLLPRVALTIGKKLDRLSRSTLMGWIGAGYLVSLDKIDHKEEIGCSPCTKDRSGHRAW